MAALPTYLTLVRMLILSVIANHEKGLPALAGYVFAPFVPWHHLKQRA